MLEVDDNSWTSARLPAVWHRGVFELVLTGRWSDIPAATWPPLVWFAAPAGVITARWRSWP